MDLPELLLSYGVTLHERGQEYIALCINHAERNPSMSVYRNGDGNFKCHCFSCGYHEGVAGAWATLNGLDPENKDHIKQALQALESTDPGGRKYAVIKPDAYKQTKRLPRKMMHAPDDKPPRMNGIKDRETGEPYGDPVGVWTFKDKEGRPIMYEARYRKADGDKDSRVFTYGQRASQSPRWECAHWEGDDRPIYNLERIGQAKQIAVFEGCRKAELAQALFDERNMPVAATAWAGGSNAWFKADWSPTGSLPVVLFPDHDEPGRKAMRNLARHLGEREIWWVEDSTRPDKWDIADEDWTAESFLQWVKQWKIKYEAPKSCEVEAEPQDNNAMAESMEPPPHTDPLPVEAYDEPMEWHEPVDIFSAIDVPSIKPEMLPKPIADWVFDVAPVVGVDPSMVALPAIVTCAAMLHDEIQLQPESKNPDWKESARLWGALVGDPSSKKSPALSKVLSIVKKIDSECHEAEGKIRYEYSLKEKAFQKQEKDYIERQSKGEEAPLPQKPELPEIPRPYAQDFTIEALRDILKHSSRGILAERDELSGWFGSFDQYKANKGADRSNWLELYNGGVRRIERVGTGSVFVRNWSCCLIGGIQPDPLRALASNMNDDGLLQRFMVVYGKPGQRGNEQEPSKALSDQWKAIVRQIWETEPHIDPVRLSPEADAIRKTIIDKAYQLIGIKFVSNSMVAHLGKWEGLSARLMLTFHAIDCAYKRIHPQSVQVSAETATRVKSFMLDFLLIHATQFYSDIIAGSESTKHFHAIAHLILSNHPNEITLRDMMRGWVGWRHAGDQVQYQVINRLTDAGWIQPATNARVSVNRRMATRYMVNPMLRDRFAAIAEVERKRRADAAAIISSIKAQHAD